MVTYRYYLGPWAWGTTPFPGWRAPAGTVGLVDLGRLPDITGPGSDRPLGFFAVSGATLGSGYTPLGQGDCREIVTTNAMQSAWRSATGYRPSGAKLVNLLWDHLTAGSDPDGGTSCLPLVPGVNGTLDLHLGGHSLVKSERFVWGAHSHTNKLRTLLRRQFQQLFADAKAGRLKDREHHRRVLDFWCVKYRVRDWKEFVPPALVKDVPGRLRHATTITDDFTRADSTTDLGNLLTWTQVTGTWGTYSNTGYKVSTHGSNESARAESDLSSADHYAQATFGGSGLGGPAARHNSSDSTYYTCGHYGGSVMLIKFVSGSSTTLGSSSYSPGSSQTYKVSTNGSEIKGYIDGTEALSATDSSITGHLRCGLYAWTSSQLIDDFEAADLAGGGGAAIFRRGLGLRAGSRGCV